MAELNTTAAAPLRRPVLRDISVSALLFLSSRASVIGMFPFGTAFFAAVFDKGIAYIGLVLMCGGLISAGAGINTARYVIAALLFWIYAKTKRHDSKVIDSAVCGVSTFIGGLLILAYSYAGVYDIMLLLIESIVSAVSYIMFTKSYGFLENRSSRSKISQEELLSAAVCLGIFITGLTGFPLPYDISLANIASLYTAMCISMHTGLAAAGSGAVCIAFISAVSAYSSALACGFYGISAIFANLLKSLGRFGIAAGFIGGIAACALLTENMQMPVSAYDTLAAVILFLITPKAVHRRMSIFFSKSLHIEAVSADVRLKEYLSMRLENAAAAFKNLNECFISESEKRLNLYRHEVNSFFDEMYTRSCAGCTMAAKCWQTDFERTYKNILSLLEAIENSGTLCTDDAPRGFRERCIRSDAFINEFNHVYELFKKDLVRIGDAKSERDIIAGQYAETSKLLEEISTDVLEGFSFREDYEEAVVAELDKIGITAFEVSVVESSLGHLEVYLGLGIGINTEKVEALLSTLFDTPMGLDESSAGSGLLKFVSKPRYNAEVVLRQVKSDASEVSGDSIASFTDGRYRKYVVISDGMGTGKKAMHESRITLRLLREFLSAGFDPEAAIGIVNSALCLKLEKDMFATIDLLCIDLLTGNTEFYKIGAAQSLISRGNNIETVFSSAAPAGIMADIKPQGQLKRLSDGDVVIMLSDGVSDAECGEMRTEWIKKKLRTAPSDLESTVQDIIETVIEKSHGMIADDMTVAAIRITENIV